MVIFHSSVSLPEGKPYTMLIHSIYFGHWFIGFDVWPCHCSRIGAMVGFCMQMYIMFACFYLTIYVHLSMNSIAFVFAFAVACRFGFVLVLYCTVLYCMCVCVYVMPMCVCVCMHACMYVCMYVGHSYCPYADVLVTSWLQNSAGQADYTTRKYKKYIYIYMHILFVSLYIYMYILYTRVCLYIYIYRLCIYIYTYLQFSTVQVQYITYPQREVASPSIASPSGRCVLGGPMVGLWSHDDLEVDFIVHQWDLRNQALKVCWSRLGKNILLDGDRIVCIYIYTHT